MEFGLLAGSADAEYRRSDGWRLIAENILSAADLQEFAGCFLGESQIAEYRRSDGWRLIAENILSATDLQEFAGWDSGESQITEVMQAGIRQKAY